MKTLANLLTSLVLGIWVIAIAIISVQNATPVSLKFLSFESIQVPMGLLLAFCAGLGVISMALTQPLWRIAGKSGNSQSEDDEFSFDEDE